MDHENDLDLTCVSGYKLKGSSPNRNSASLECDADDGEICSNSADGIMDKQHVVRCEPITCGKPDDDITGIAPNTVETSQANGPYDANALVSYNCATSHCGSATLQCVVDDATLREFLVLKFYSIIL